MGRGGSLGNWLSSKALASLCRAALCTARAKYRAVPQRHSSVKHCAAKAKYGFAQSCEAMQGRSIARSSRAKAMRGSAKQWHSKVVFHVSGISER